MSVTVVFVDTNVLLHYQRLEQIDWLALTQSGAVTIVLPPIVFRELNKQKETHPVHRVRKRAQAVLISLGDLFETNLRVRLRAGVEAEFLVHDPLIDFAANRLRTDLQDDFLLASILDYQSANSCPDCRLATADVGLRLKSGAHNVAVVSLPDHLKLPEEADPNEKRIKDLEGEIREIKHQVPLLRLCFEDKTALAKFSLTKPNKLGRANVEDQIAELRREYPKMPVPSDKPAPTQSEGDAFRKALAQVAQQQNLLNSLAQSQIPPGEVQRYNDELEEFFNGYRIYIGQLSAYGDVKLRTICLSIGIQNEGTAPAEDIDVHLHFPDGFEMFDEETLPKPPDPPEPPDRPQTALQNLQESMARITAYPRSFRPILPDFRPLANISSPCIKRTNSYEVHFHVNKLKHGLQGAFRPLYLAFPTFETARSFQIDYALHAGNMPKPVKDKLCVVVETTVKSV